MIRPNTGHARPIRVCYLVPIGAETQAILSAVFAESYSRWGGLFTGVIPVENGAIHSRYKSWLQYLDPDFLYSYCDIDASDLHEIDVRGMPAVVVRHNVNMQTYAPHMTPELISSLSLLPFLSLQRSFLRPHPTKIVDAFPGWQRDELILDSFGVRSISPGYSMVWPMDLQLRKYVTSLALVPNDIDKVRTHYERASDEVTTSAALLRHLAADRGIVTMAQLASSHAQERVEQVRHPWASSYSIVVGNEIADRVSFWNARIHYANHVFQHIPTLRVPAESLSDHELVDTLVEYVGRTNPLTIGANGGQSWIAIRSSSVAHDALESFKDRLFAKTHAYIDIATIDDLQNCLPAEETLRGAHHYVIGSIEPVDDEREMFVHADLPTHILEVGDFPPQLKRGHWAIDITIPRTSREIGPFGNRGVWVLPRRWQICNIFSRSAESRINAEHNLTAYPSFQNRDHNVRLSSDEGSIVNSVFRSGHYGLTIDIRNRLSQADLYYGTGPSDSGRLLFGALGLFGNLFEAYRTISNRFWRNCFMEMAAPAIVRPAERREDLKQRLRADLRRQGRASVTTDEDWDAISEAAMRLAHFVRAPLPIARLHQFRNWRKDDAKQAQVDDEALESDLVTAIGRMCQLGVLAQGYQWRCRRCGHRNWRTVNDLQSVLKCTICAYEKHIEAAFEWSFLLNQFLAEGFRERGLRAVIWALGALQMQTRFCFAFAPPTNLFSTPEQIEQRTPNAEVDLCCLMDGDLCIGEVKESDRDFNDSTSSDLVTVAKRVRPDRIVLACADKQARSKMEQQVENIRNRTQAIGCSVSAIVPGNDYDQFERTLT